MLLRGVREAVVRWRYSTWGRVDANDIFWLPKSRSDDFNSIRCQKSNAIFLILRFYKVLSMFVSEE